jgi:hypothetical protein
MAMSQPEFERDLERALSGAGATPSPADLADRVGAQIDRDSRRRVAGYAVRVAVLAIVVVAASALAFGFFGRWLGPAPGAGRWILWIPIVALVGLVAAAASLVSSLLLTRRR